MTKNERRKLNPKGDFMDAGYCGKPHRLSDGVPLAHECYILNSEGLTLEFIHGADIVKAAPYETSKWSTGGRKKCESNF